MAFFAVLALLSSRLGVRQYAGLTSDLAGQASVQLTDLTAQNRLDVAQQALSIVAQTAPNVDAARLNDADAAKLLEPWLGDNVSTSLPEGITLPVLITLSGSTEAQRRSIAQALEAANIDAVIEDHNDWADELGRTARAYNLSSWLILLLTFFAGTAVFAQVGAADNFITKLFVMRSMKVGAISAVMGAVGAFLFLGLYRLLRGPSDNGLLMSLTPRFSDITIVAALCLIFTAVCAISTAVSARGILHKTRLYQ
jgi:cell division transport system permease protein